VAGDGPLACTIAQFLVGSGTEVVLAAPGPRLLPGTGAVLDSSVGKRLASLGCGIVAGAVIQRVVPGWDAESGTAVTLSDGSTHTVDAVIACPRRIASAALLGGRKLGIERGGDGRIATGRQFATGAPGVYAIGGVREPGLSPELCQLDGEAVADIFLGRESGGPSAAAHAIHRLPGAAWAGVEREDAEAAGLAVRTGFADLKSTLSARMGRASEGFVLLLAETATGEILGVQAVATDAAELVSHVVWAMRLEYTVWDLAGLAAPWPSLGEAVILAARAACGE
jgi:pyruvate/2-oxoglutarate dehydrogenase complex dihydrolipoamide dehydrogenase (E3) component